MCIGIPMQVSSVEPGHAWCTGREGPRRVRTALLGGELQPGDWVLVFIDSAQERLDIARAREIEATLELLQSAFTPGRDAMAEPAEAAFELPSRWTTEQLRALSGSPATDPADLTTEPITENHP